MLCGSLFAEGDNKVRNRGLVAGKYRGSAQWDCNTNLKLTGKSFCIIL